MKCGSCGFESGSDAVVCEQCGSNLAAQRHLTLGLAHGMEALDPENPNPLDSYSHTVEELRAAIGLGLPRADEMTARWYLGASLSALVQQRLEGVAHEGDAACDEVIGSDAFAEATDQMERALVIDAEGKHNFFTDPIQRSLLRHLDFHYSLTGHRLERAKGAEAAIEYWKEKLSLLDYVAASNPMLITLNELGYRYVQTDRNEEARKCFRQVVEAEAVTGDEREADTKARAKNNLRLLEGGLQEATSTDKKSGCFIATVVFNGINAPEVILLRSFRDKHLATNVVGRTFLTFYQHAGPPLSRIASTFSFLKTIARVLLRSLIRVLPHAE